MSDLHLVFLLYVDESDLIVCFHLTVFHIYIYIYLFLFFCVIDIFIIIRVSRC